MKRKPVVAAGAHRDRDLDRDVEGRDDEGEERRLARLRVEVIDRRGAEQVFRFAFVVGVDGDQAGLGVGRAFVERELDRGALGDRVGVAEDALRGVEDHVLGGFGFPGLSSSKEVTRSG